VRGAERHRNTWRGVGVSVRRGRIRPIADRKSAGLSPVFAGRAVGLAAGRLRTAAAESRDRRRRAFRRRVGPGRSQAGRTEAARRGAIETATCAATSGFARRDAGVRVGKKPRAIGSHAAIPVAADDVAGPGELGAGQGLRRDQQLGRYEDQHAADRNAAGDIRGHERSDRVPGGAEPLAGAALYIGRRHRRGWRRRPFPTDLYPRISGRSVPGFDETQYLRSMSIRSSAST
jgi:hypothetical protein